MKIVIYVQKFLLSHFKHEIRTLHLILLFLIIFFFIKASCINEKKNLFRLRIIFFFIKAVTSKCMYMYQLCSFGFRKLFLLTIIVK